MTPWVRRLIVANVAVYFLTLMVPEASRALAFMPARVIVFPWMIYTAFTYMFVHGGLGHIAFNMLGLLFLGPRVEAHLGGARFLRLYLAGGFGGAALSVITPSAPIIGASGAVYGILLGYAMFWPREKLYIMGVLPLEARWLVAGLTALSLFGGFGRTSDGIAHFAHLGGFAGAYLYLKWLQYNSPTKKFKRLVYADVPQGAVQEMVAVRRWQNIKRDNLHEVNRDEVDRLLTKLDQQGVGSLTLDERAFLDRFAAH